MRRQGTILAASEWSGEPLKAKKTFGVTDHSTTSCSPAQYTNSGEFLHAQTHFLLWAWTGSVPGRESLMLESGSPTL